MKENKIEHRESDAINLDAAFAEGHDSSRQVVQTGIATRTLRRIDGADVILDRFASAEGAICCFMRLVPGEARTVRFVLEGNYRIESCPAGGWLVKCDAESAPSYWLPHAPVRRALDDYGRILTEEPARISGLESSPGRLAFVIEVPSSFAVDNTLWRFERSAGRFMRALERPTVLERQPLFLWGSFTTIRRLADVYACVIHGNVYENRFDWKHKRKICSEFEANALYVALVGREQPGGCELQGLVRRQLVISLISRQAPDGGWYHGEWTDMMESHYRYHNGGVMLLAAAYEEWGDPSVRVALDKAAAFIAAPKDSLEIGTWYLHDSLEQSAELMDRSGARWIPDRMFGKAPTTKLILNTHLDTIVSLDRHRSLTGSSQYVADITSARAATRRLLEMRPAEALYRVLYWAVGLTLLPAEEARRLPLPLRIVRRLSREKLLPKLHVVKRRYPRLVMPGGLIDRHLARLHFGVNYHTTNIMDLTRLTRRFPEEDFAAILDAAAAAAADPRMLRHWVETKQRQSLGFWVEAAYQLCTVSGAFAYRRYLGDAMLVAEDAGLGMPPSVLGANPEIVAHGARVPCPSPASKEIRVANLSHGDVREILVVNASRASVPLAWEHGEMPGLHWVDRDGRPAAAEGSPPVVPARSWLLGRQNCAS